jgi:hypothetical protein
MPFNVDCMRAFGPGVLHSLCLLVLCAGSVAASTEAQNPSQIRAGAIRAHLEFLASDLLEGRDAGTRGYDLAAN